MGISSQDCASTRSAERRPREPADPATAFDQLSEVWGLERRTPTDALCGGAARGGPPAAGRQVSIAGIAATDARLDLGSARNL